MNLINVPAGLETAAFALGPGELISIPAFLKTFFPGKKPWIIADGNTWNAAGKRVSQILTDAGFTQNSPRILPAEPKLHPDFTLSQEIAAQMPENCVPLAVGSGVVNDLVKCAAGINHVHYCCVPTAASVDGYTSSGGAMRLADGFKKTVPCPAPYGILADTDVLKSAPPDMLASGYADLLTKIPAGGDWIIVSTLGLEPIRSDVWDVVQMKLRAELADPEDLSGVFAGLAATGYAMQMYGESRPASGAEHLFSHVWEMEGLTQNGIDVSHGFKVGIGLIASTKLMEYVIRHSAEDVQKHASSIPTRAEREQEIDILLSRGCYGTAKDVAMEKFLDGAAAKARREMIWTVWNSLRPRLTAQLLPSDEAVRMLKNAHCPVTPDEIGLDREQYLHGIYTAQLIRKRYTILDFLYEAGLLHAAVDEML